MNEQLAPWWTDARFTDEQRQQMDATKQILMEALLPYAGRLMTPELKEEITKVTNSRMTIVKQLIEHECPDF